MKWIFVIIIVLAITAYAWRLNRPASPRVERQIDTSLPPASQPATAPAPTTHPIDTGPRVVSSTQPADASQPFIQHLDDGSMLVDRLYPLRGSGTENDPYQVPWVYLISARETYQPDAGQWAVPPRIEMLDGKHVTVRGYLAIPQFTKMASRVLLTWDMIDACHGTRPKPVEALEVALTTPLEMEPHSLTRLQLRGVLKLDKEMKQGWMLAVYRLDNAQIVAIEK